MFVKGDLRAPFPASETILFAEQQDNFANLLRMARAEAGLTCKQLTAVAEAYGEVNNGGAVSNWEAGTNTPTPLQWDKMRSALELPPYERAIRPFFADDYRPYTDVWDFPTVSTYPGKHPCEKPLSMMEHIVRTSSRPGDVVLDTFCGSGATAEAARNLDRRAIVGDFDRHWCDWTARRLSQGNLFAVTEAVA